MKRALALFTVLFVLGLISGCGSTYTGSNTVPAPVQQAQIAYLQTTQQAAGAQGIHALGSTGPTAVYMMNVDGTGQHQVGEAGNFFAVDLSHDGSKLAVTSADNKAYVVSATCCEVTLVSPSDTYADFAEFSPDGKKVYFVNLAVTPYAIWSVNVDGSEPKNLGKPDLWMHEFTVAPDGTVYFTAFDPETRTIGLWAMASDGSNLRQLEIATDNNNPNYYHHPSMSVLGNKIVLEYRDAWGSSNIAVVNTDGTGRVNITSDGKSEDPTVVGDVVFFTSWKNGNYQMYSMNIDGSNVKRLTNNTTDDYFGWGWSD